MRNCPDCNSLIEDHAIFCDNCGFRLSPVSSQDASQAPSNVVAAPPATPSGVPSAVRPSMQSAMSASPAPGTCSVCGSINVPGEMFCQNCGVQLAPVVSTPPPPPAPVVDNVPPPMIAPPISEPSPIPSFEAALPQATPYQPPPKVAPEIPAIPTPQPEAATNIPAIKAPVEPTDITPPPPSYRNCPACNFANPMQEQYCQNCGLLLESSSSPLKSPFEQAASSQSISANVQPAQVATPQPPPPKEQVGQPEAAQPASIEEADRFGTAPLDASAGLKEELFIKGKLIVRATKAEITIPPAKNELTIGRSDPVRGVFPDIDLTTHGGDIGGVSRLHARIFLKDGQLSIEDLNSTNYSFLNRQRLEPQQHYSLNSGDEIRLGLVVLEYY